MALKTSDFRLETPNTWCTIRRALEIMDEHGYHNMIYIGTEHGEGWQYIGAPDAEKITARFEELKKDKKKLYEDKYYLRFKHKFEQINNGVNFPEIDADSDTFLELVHYASELKKLASITYNHRHYLQDYVDILDRPIIKPVKVRIQDDCLSFVVAGLEQEGEWWKGERSEKNAAKKGE